MSKDCDAQSPSRTLIKPCKIFSKTEILPKVGTGRGVRGPKKIKIKTGICKGSRMLS